MKQEKIVCAAIYVMPVKDGYEGSPVVKGINYESIMKDGILSEIAHPTYCRVFTHGFVTNKNRFVDALEARRIASDAGQAPMVVLTSNPPKIKPLLPEDLY